MLTCNTVHLRSTPIKTTTKRIPRGLPKAFQGKLLCSFADTQEHDTRTNKQSAVIPLSPHDECDIDSDAEGNPKSVIFARSIESSDTTACATVTTEAGASANVDATCVASKTKSTAPANEGSGHIQTETAASANVDATCVASMTKSTAPANDGFGNIQPQDDKSGSGLDRKRSAMSVASASSQQRKFKRRRSAFNLRSKKKN